MQQVIRHSTLDVINQRQLWRDQNKALTCHFLVVFDLNEGSDSCFYRHDGEEFPYILAGKLESHYGEEVMRLIRGDSIFYDSSIPHGYLSIVSSMPPWYHLKSDVVQSYI